MILIIILLITHAQICAEFLSSKWGGLQPHCVESCSLPAVRIRPRATTAHIFPSTGSRAPQTTLDQRLELTEWTCRLWSPSLTSLAWNPTVLILPLCEASRVPVIPPGLLQVLDLYIYNFYVVLGYPDPDAPATIANARAAGISYVDAYLFPCPKCSSSAATQVASMGELGQLGSSLIKPNVGMVWERNQPA